MTSLIIEDNPFAQKLGIREWHGRDFTPPKPEEYLVADIIPANSLVALQTNGIYGKTTLSLQLAMAVAFNTTFLERFPCLQPGKVLCLNSRDTDEDNHRRFNRLEREWAKTSPALIPKIETESGNLTYISMNDDCYSLSPHLVDASGSMTKTYSYLHQFSEYYKTKLIVLDPVEDFFPENLKNIGELYRRLRHIKSTILLVVGDKDRYGAFHEVEVAMSLNDNGLELQSVYTGRKEIKLEMGAGIWNPV